MNVSRKLRIVELAHRRYGVRAEVAKEIIESSDFGMNPAVSNNVLARSLKVYVQAKALSNVMVDRG